MSEVEKLFAKIGIKNRWVMLAVAVGGAYWAWSRSAASGGGTSPATDIPNQQLPAAGKSVVGGQAILVATPDVPWE